MIEEKEERTEKKPRTLSWYWWAKTLCFWGALIACFLPSTIATLALFPVVEAGTGQKLAVGFLVLALNLSVLVAGIFRLISVNVPLINWTAIVYLIFDIVVNLPFFKAFIGSVRIIAVCAVVGSIAYCVLWSFHMKYKAQYLTAKTNKEMGII